MNSSSPGSPPAPPSLKSSYKQGTNVYFDFLDRFLNAEKDQRGINDPQRLQHQQNLQAQFGPTQYAQQTQALQSLNPAWYKLQSQLGNQLSSDLSQGYGLAPGQEHQLTQQIEGSQSARGNILGSAAGTAEAFALGDRGNQMYQQRVQNAQNYQQASTPSQQLALIPPVSPDRSMAYVNPNAGFQGVQFGQQGYQNQLGAYGLANQQQGGNPWMSAIGSAGSIIGSIAQAYGFSDPKLKSNVKRLGTNPQGLGVYSYKIKPPARHEVGVMADEVGRKMPHAVHKDPESGYRMVDYAKIAMP